MLNIHQFIENTILRPRIATNYSSENFFHAFIQSDGRRWSTLLDLESNSLRTSDGSKCRDKPRKSGNWQEREPRKFRITLSLILRSSWTRHEPYLKWIYESCKDGFLLHFGGWPLHFGLLPSRSNSLRNPIWRIQLGSANTKCSVNKSVF